VAAQEKHARGEKARSVDLVLRPFAKFLRMYLVKLGWLDGMAGFVVAITGSFYVFLKYAKLRGIE
jgi:hypothetical protein